MSTLRINNIEAQSIPASPTLDEKVKITNSSGDILVNIDGKTSGITTIGINTTDGNIKFDENSNVVVTGIVTATKFSGDFEPVHVNASGIVTASSFVGTGVSVVGVVTATSFVGSGANLTNLPDQSFNDDKIVNDISTLALKVSALENSTASNTNSTFVDTYQDSAGISTTTNVSRSINEYVSSGVDTLSSETTLVSGYNKSAAQIASNNFAINTISANNWEIIDDATHTRTTGHYNSDASREQGTVWGLFASSGQASNSTYQIFGQYTNTSSADVYIGMDTKANSPRFVWTRFKFDRWWGTGTGVNVTLSGSNNLSGSWTVLKTMTPTTTTGEGNQDSGSFSNTTEYRYYQLKIHNIVGAVDIGIKDLLVIGKTISSNVSASGSYQSTTINAAATTSKMGVVITYTDFAGTATLNTDLKVFLSANNGANYTQVTLVAQPNFATGVKMAKANDVTISNTGTQLKYKVEFANQSEGSKSTRVTGVSLQY